MADHDAAQLNAGVTVAVDPITTEIVRHGLNSAASQMKRALVRTAFSPIIYEVLDFAVALYDRRVQLLAQAPSLPIFMGTMSFCVEAAIDAVGGEEEFADGDVILYNIPYGTGSHAQDAAMVMPVYLDEGTLIGYAAIKAHWLDIGAKDPYCTDTIDVQQEGTFFPGVWLYRRGELVSDIYRIALANSRVPKMVAGDINAELIGLRAGASAFVRVVQRYGQEVFDGAVERMFAFGEATVRSYFERIPDGRYVGHGEMDDNGVSDDVVPFEVAVEVSGSSVCVDYTAAPPQQPGPINCPFPSTVSGSRIAIALLAGGGEAPNEGHFRALEVKARPGSLFYPVTPAPCYLYAWPTIQAIEVIYHALSQAMPDDVPACSVGDIAGLTWWGVREQTGEPWADGSPHPVGQGAHSRGDGANSLMHVSEAATRLPPTEVWEARNPWLIEGIEFAADSGGPGQYRGGLGLNISFRVREDSWLTSTVERTRNPSWGLAGGGAGRPNSCAIQYPDGSRRELRKITRLLVPRDAVIDLKSGGGGGWGDPSHRDPAAVRADLRGGYITEEFARSHFPHAFEDDEA